MAQTYYKGSQDFLSEDSALKEKITYEEFEEKEAAPGNTDWELPEVYDYFRQFIKQTTKDVENDKGTV